MTDLSKQEIDARIAFHDADEIMEVDFSHLGFENSADVNRFYDRLEDRIAETGHDQLRPAVRHPAPAL